MDKWLSTCLLLCCYGFFKELRPSEPFLTQYLLGPQHNLTESEIYYEIYPVWTYAYLSLLIVVFLLTDLLRYKPVIVFEGIGYVATWSLLLWARGVHWIQFMEFCYGITTSTEVAYYTYIYAQVEGKYYQRVTGYTRCAILTGRLFSGVLAQLLISFSIMDYHSLNYFSLASVMIALCISITLPAAQTSIYFHRGRSSEEQDEADAASEIKATPATDTHINKDRVMEINNVIKVIRYLWQDFKDAYTNIDLLKWSIWWAFATCINFQVSNYIQPLWETILPFQETTMIYNGSVDAMSTFLGAIAAFGVGYFPFNWKILGELTLALISLGDAFLLAFMGMTSDIWICYVNYIVFRVSYQVLITVASYQVAKELKTDSFGLVFGINMFFALLIQTFLTLIVIEWMEAGPRTQFVIYGWYFGLLAVLFFIFSGVKFVQLGCKGIQSSGLWERPTSDDKTINPRNENNGNVELR